MTTPAEKRRICWPDPDATCLEGGCLQCGTYPLRSLAVIERWATEAGPVPHRFSGSRDALEAFYYGRLRGAGQ